MFVARLAAAAARIGCQLRGCVCVILSTLCSQATVQAHSVMRGEVVYNIQIALSNERKTAIKQSKLHKVKSKSKVDRGALRLTLR